MTEEEAIELVKQVKPDDHEQVLRLAKLLKKYSDVFVKDDTNLKQCPLAKHQIDTQNNHSINHPPYRTNLKTKEVINEIIKKHLANKFFESSSSPWASPVVLVSKKDGSLRFCIGYRRLNSITMR
jgi:hypothetical protein